MATSATEFGMTLTFASSVDTGGYVSNGQWFKPVNITAFSPASGPALGLDIAHGAQINPFPTYIKLKRQGMQKQSVTRPGMVISGTEQVFYEASRNVAAGVSPGTPLVMAADQSLITTIALESYLNPGSATTSGGSKLETAAVFTCVAATPAAGSFRPGYCGTQKDHSVNISQIDWGKLGPFMDLTANVPPLSQVTRHVERPWLDWIQGWRGRGHHPRDNMARYDFGNGYGRDFNTEWGDCMLSIKASDYSQVDKEALMYGMIQVGLDLFSVIQHSEGTSTGCTNTTLTDTTKSWIVNEWVGAEVWSQNADGMGQHAVVTSNTATTLTMSAGWLHNHSSSTGGNPGSGRYYRVGCPYSFYQADGGHGYGRKGMIMFAGWMLNRQDILDAVTIDCDRQWTQPRRGILFQEDQAFYVQETRPGVYNWGSPHCDGGTASSVTATTLTDLWKTQWTSSDDWDVSPDEWVGAEVEMGGSTAIVTSNTTNKLTFAAGWVGGTPPLGPYRVYKNLPGHTYVAADVGMPEDAYAHCDPVHRRALFWGISGPLYHSGRTRTDSDGDSRLLEGSASGENANPYRWCCTMNGWIGWILGYMSIPGFREVFDTPALFDYADRYYDGFASYHPSSGGSIRALPTYISEFEAFYARGGRPVGSPGSTVYDYWHMDMWDAHRASLEVLPAMTEIRTLDQARAAFDIDLASLANGSAVQSDMITNGNNRTAAIVAVRIKSGAVAPTANTLYKVYLLQGDGTIRTDNAGATKAAITIENARTLGTVRVTATANKNFYGFFDTAALGVVLGNEWGIAIKNDSGQALSTTEGDHAKGFVYHNGEIV